MMVMSGGNYGCGGDDGSGGDYGDYGCGGDVKVCEICRVVLKMSEMGWLLKMICKVVVRVREGGSAVVMKWEW